MLTCEFCYINDKIKSRSRNVGSNVLAAYWIRLRDVQEGS